jgi:hypothetical protein
MGLVPASTIALPRSFLAQGTTVTQQTETPFHQIFHKLSVVQHSAALKDFCCEQRGFNTTLVDGGFGESERDDDERETKLEDRRSFQVPSSR